MEAFVVFVIIFIVVVIYMNMKTTTTSGRKYSPPTYTTVATTQTQTVYRPPEVTIEERLIQNNPNFSRDSFKRFSEMVYIRYLASIMRQDAVDVKGFLHRQLYEAHINYIDTIKMAGRHIQIENIIVNNISFYDYEIQNGIETLKVRVNSRMNQYETDKNGLVISGYRSRVITKDEILTFERDHNKLHKSDVVKCPNCLATLSNVSKVCEYCGAAIKFNDETNDGWLLSDVRTL
jgi:hypothetical protein